jgi:cytoskeleton protein RodZ
MNPAVNDDIGGRLRAARRARGATVRDIAAITKIAPHHLEAIERNEFEALPGGVFRRGYVKAFAAAVGLDPTEFARIYGARFEAAEPPEPPPLQRADFDNRPLVERGALVAAVMAVAAAAWVMWRPAAGPPPQDPWLDASGPRVTLTGLPPSQPSRLERGGNDEVAYAMSMDALPALQVEIRATAPSASAASQHGARVIYRLLQAGDQVVIDANRTIDLRIGNAGAVTYSINGARGRPLGADGEAVTVRLTPDTLDRYVADVATVT